MKKIIYSLALAAIGMLAACSDFLETTSPSKQSSETTYGNAAMAEAGLMGVYGTMTNTYIFGQKIPVNWQGLSDTESTRAGVSGNSAYNVVNGDEGAGNYYSHANNNTTRWDQLFIFAEMASTAVEGMRNSPLLESQPVLGRKLLGEALTLRAIAYFELVRRYGDIPFKTGTSNSDLSNVYLGKVDRDTVYSHLVSEMQEAVEYLPWATSGSSVERVTKGFAKGMLARIALFAGGWSLRDGNTFPDMDVEHHPTIPEMNNYFVGRPKNWRYYYEVAAKQTAEMLGDPLNPHKLDPDYEHIWSTVNGMRYNDHMENLFEVAFGLGNNGDVGTLMGWSVAANTIYSPNVGQSLGANYACTNMYYFYSFSPKDKRRDVTVGFGRWVAANQEEISGEYLNTYFMKWRAYWMSDDFMQRWASAGINRISTGINWIVMRMPDIHLMYAEAQNALAGADVAHTAANGMTPRQALEAVRERAFGAGSPEITNYVADFQEAVINERAWEFGGESVRRMDLVRWGLLEKNIEQMKEALVLMMDGQHPVKIMDKTYQPTDFPDVVYYKRISDADKRIDYSDPNYPNYNKRLAASPGTDYIAVNWFPKAYARPTDPAATPADRLRTDPGRVLLWGTGLNPSYDYSPLLGRLHNGADIQSYLNQYPMGNGTCYYRYFHAIYYADINDSKGALTNSYGF